MTKKSQRARARAKAAQQPRLGDEIVRPDGSVIRFIREEDDDLKPAEHFRSVDTLALMLRNGSITAAMHDAGQHFSQDFARAFGSGVASPKLDGMPASTAPGGDMIEKNAWAAREIRDALDAVGGSCSPAGSALWFVAGMQLSVREWATRRGWCERPISQHQANGILIAGLGVLARYYGYECGESRPRRRICVVP